MKAFPEEYQLLSFFESEPEIQDSKIPWYYNTLTFKKTTPKETLICTFSPAYGDLSLTLIQDGIDKIKLDLSHIEKVEILNEKKEYLRIEFNNNLPFKSFLLTLTPEVCIVWGSELS